MFPYSNELYSDRLNENEKVAKFAHGRDYHVVVPEKIKEAINEFGLMGEYKIMSDISFLNEKICAYLAGLGVIGKNTLLLTEKYGSNVVLGEVITDQEFADYDRPLDTSYCDTCDKCERACPTKALNNGMIREKCLSYLNQHKSKDYHLYDKMRLSAYGCDICQDICPVNKKTYQGLDELYYDESSYLNFEEFKTLNEITYKERYAGKTFHWIGYLPMLRNLLVLQANKKKLHISEIEEYQLKYKDETWFYDHLEYLKNKIKEES